MAARAANEGKVVVDIMVLRKVMLSVQCIKITTKNNFQTLRILRKAALNLLSRRSLETQLACSNAKPFVQRA